MGSSRHALVIGSQCAALANQPLSFLPERAEKLYEKLTERERGGCDPDRSRLLLDPDLAVLASAVREAVKVAAEDKATLVLAFIGHAAVTPGDHSASLFLMPLDGNPEDPDDESGYEIGHRLRRLTRLPELDGLILILDACHSGLGVRDTIRESMSLKAHVRQELLAGTYERLARGGCFSKSLIKLMDEGRSDLSKDYLGIQDAANFGAQSCHGIQDPPIFVGSGRGTEVSDPGLWVSRNVASRTAWGLSGTPEGALAVALTEGFQPTPVVEDLLAALSRRRLVVLYGPAGAGKSTLIAALTRPELIPDIPNGYLSGVAFRSLSPTVAEIAETLERQLEHIEGFAQARAEYETQVGRLELDHAPAIERLVFGPLARLNIPVGRRIRLAIDGLDELDEGIRGGLLASLAAASNNPDLQRVTLLVGSRLPFPEDVLESIPSREVVRLDVPGQLEVAQYLAGTALDTVLAESLEAEALTWLQLRLLTFMATVDGTRIGSAENLDRRLYSDLLAMLTPPSRLVLTVLAAAGSGPVLPISIAVAACAALGGPSESGSLRDAVLGLGATVARADPGTPYEHLGLFHDTLVESLWTHEDTAAGLRDAHAAILGALAHVDGEAEQQYARQRAPEHLWFLGRYQEAIEAVLSTLGPSPADNRDALRLWTERSDGLIPPDDPVRLRLLDDLALWTGRSGDASGAVEQYRQLLEERLDVLGPEHQDTLSTRHRLAHWTGRARDADGARDQFRALLEDQLRVLGPDHPDTLATRHGLALWTGRAGQPAAAREEFFALLQDRQRVLGRDHPDTLATRHGLAHVVGRAGDPLGAKREFQALLDDRLRVLGPDHQDTLATRHSLALWTGRLKDPVAARDAFRSLLHDRLQLLGPDAPVTLYTRHSLAEWSGRAGDARDAREQFRALLEDRRRVLGEDNPDTLATREGLAEWTGRAGDPAGARLEYEAVLEARIRVQGQTHRDTLSTRRKLLRWSA